MPQQSHGPALQIRGLTHFYGPNRILSGITLDVRPGEVVALAGENGAGKSTVMRIVGGYLAPSAGQVSWQARPVQANIHLSEAQGITLVHQEFALIPDMTVAENIHLGREPTRFGMVDAKRMQRQARDALTLLNSDLHPDARLRDLSVANWQVVELAKAFAARPALLLMDEPTAVLGRDAVDALFSRIRAFSANGGTVIFTSHRLDEVREIADRVTVLRDGGLTLDQSTADVTEHDIASAMVGRELSDLFAPRSPAPKTAPLLSVDHLCVPRALGTPIQDASFDLHPGEILGVAGLVGSGRTEMFEGLVGLRPARAARFTIRGVGRDLPRGRDSWALGMAYLTEDRKSRGLLLDESQILNQGLTFGALRGGPILNHKADRDRYLSAKGRFDIRSADPLVPAGRLSGGNQQKLLLAKILATDPDIIILDEPTRGVDIGAKAQIYRLIADLAAQAKSVVVISSELPELIGLAHRIMVLDRGRIAGVLHQPEHGHLTEAQVLRLGLGLSHPEELSA